MNDLEQYFFNNTGNLIHKWVHYFDIYDRYFSKFRNTDVSILEIGVSHGGSLHMWRDYFGPKVTIFGVDANPECKALENGQIRMFIGSQEDRTFLRDLKTKIPRVDILIDDGGHTMKQQITTFEEMFEHVKDDGIYLCEDTHTSYWKKYRGGYRRRGTFIEYSKGLIDSIHAWHSKTKKLKVSDFTRSAYALHYYDSIVVIEKKPIEKPSSLQKGKPAIPGCYV